ncbi:MAG: N-acyl-D-amino-acid deacylase family protein [Fimbriimonadaceae bacterium]
MLAALIPLTITYSILIQGGTIIDGTGAPEFKADLRIQGSRIIEIAPHLIPLKDEKIISAKNFVVTPGFIDAHSHAAGGIDDDPLAVSQITQGITTAVSGQDGGWSEPIHEFFAEIEESKPAINFAAFTGHGGIRGHILGENYKRLATQAEIQKMTALVAQDMKDGALGLSSGLEYDPGYYSNTEEIIAFAKATKANNGLYISHMRDEADKTFEAIQELQKIGKDAGIPAQISHIKLGSAAVWGQATKAAAYTNQPSITADVYPYTYWQSTIAALSPSRDWNNRNIWVKALADVGGPANVRLTKFTPDPTWQGKTLDVLSKELKKDPISIIQEILKRTTDGEGSQSVVVTAMQESDLETFIRAPRIMFCSDGSIGGSHPRGAGAFPRILGRYVRERKTINLVEAIRKMTSLTARTFGLVDRGELKPNTIADITIFDPKTIQDHATPTDPRALSTGVKTVIVSGQITLSNGKPTGARNGKIIRKNQ